MPDMNRREARKQAFLLLFQYKFQPEDMDRLLKDFFQSTEAGKEREYIDRLVKTVIDNAEKIDSMIEEFSKGWSIDRISSVSLTALRLGICEMLYFDDIPPAVSVNEAVSLSKEFEGEEAAPFVNGILGKIKESI